MADFNTYYPKLKIQEGGYASAEYAASKGDKGGETYLGIARNYNPNWAGWKLVDEYKKKIGKNPPYNTKIPDPRIDALAKDLSKKEYWDKMKMDGVKNQSIAEYIMDFGFNSGMGTSANATQSILGLPRKGKMDDATISAINSADQKDLFDKLQAYRINLVSNIKTLKPDIIKGLINRAKSFTFSSMERVAETVKKNP